MINDHDSIMIKIYLVCMLTLICVIVLFLWIRYINEVYTNMN